MRGLALGLSVTLLPLLLLGSLGGCQLFTEQAQGVPGPPYPEVVEQGEVFDIQVFRDVTALRFTNTTTMDFGPSVVWLNKRYSLPIPGLASGQTAELDLREFVDQFGETFRAGGFFAQRDPAPVVLAQLETAGADGEPVLYGLIVVENELD